MAPKAVEHLLSLKSGGKLTPGEVLRLSPEEPQHATIIKIAERIEEGAEEAELLQWKRVLLSYPAKFTGIGSDYDAYFYVTNAREQVHAAGNAMVHKTSQIVMDIHGFRLKKEAELGPLKPEQISGFYKDGWVGGWVYGWMGGWVDGRMGGWVDGWMGGCVDGCMGGW